MKHVRDSAMLICAVASLFLLAGCASGGGASVSPEGTWGDPGTAQSPSLEFEGGTSGDYHGTDGCNQIGGAYVQDESGVVDLGAMRTTHMLCEGVDDWLNHARTATITDETMTFFDESGTEVGTLTRG